MLSLTVAEIASAVQGKVVVGDPNLVVSGAVTTDSRELTEGGVFFAKYGEADDGHRYLESLETRAALAVVSEPNSSLTLPQIQVTDTVEALSGLASYVLDKVRKNGLKVIGITGSNGKTSTKTMLAAILSQVGKTIAPRDSFNNEVGLPLTVLKLEADTQYLVLELGAAGLGSIEKLARWTRPDVGIQLKVGMAHAGAFGGIEQTAKIKAEMMPFIQSVAILNQDDPVVRDFPVPASSTRIGFGFSENADVQILRTDLSLEGTKVSLRLPDGAPLELNLRILGEHQAMNAAAATTAALALGIDSSVVQKALNDLNLAERWRMQPMWREDEVLIINDAYNASPDSMKAGLQALATLGRQGHRTVAVLGEMAELGEYSKAEHEALGLLVVRYNIDKLFVVGSGAKILHMAATQEGSWDGESEFYENADAAFAAINAKLLPGDVVLVKSSNSSGLRFLGDRLAGVA